MWLEYMMYTTCSYFPVKLELQKSRFHFTSKDCKSNRIQFAETSFKTGNFILLKTDLA